jgi:RimJ/RimL family protein N-acetyltransferase
MEGNMRFVLQSQRLLLRPPGAADVRHFAPLLDDFAVSRNLARVPHPYTEDDGYAFVMQAAEERLSGKSYVYAILRKSDFAFLGACGLHRLEEDEDSFEIGYWLGKPFWGQGLATEAAGRVRDFAFAELGAARLVAGRFDDNPASARVLEKLGLTPYKTDMRMSLSRGHPVASHRMALARPVFGDMRHG